MTGFNVRLSLLDSEALLVSLEKRGKFDVRIEDLVENALNGLNAQFFDELAISPGGVSLVTFDQVNNTEMRPFVLLGIRIGNNFHDGFFRIEVESQRFAKFFKKTTQAILFLYCSFKRGADFLDFFVLRVKFVNACDVF